MIKQYLPLSLLLLTFNAWAQDAQEDDNTGWTGKGEFGLVSTGGNSDTTTVNLGLEFIREGDLWRHRIAAAALKAEENDQDTADRFSAEYQADYKLNEISYILGSGRYERDDFSGFEYQQTVALGYGRELLTGETHKLKGELGIGYRRIKDAISNQTSSDGIVRGLLDYSWAISATATLSNRLLVESGSDNTFVENDSALNVAINDAFALQFGFAIRHNSDAPLGRDDTDTVTTANLVYNFN